MKSIIPFTLITVVMLSLLALVSCEIEEDSHTHAFGEWETVKEATCTEDGSKARSCSCGESETDVIYAMGHTEEVLAEKPATCTEAGLTEGKKCSVCGEITVNQEEILALNHDYKYTEETDENGNIVTVAVCQREDCGEVKENPAGLYDADNKLLASWDELVNTYGVKIEIGQSDYNYQNNNKLLCNILKNNENLKNGTKLIIGDSATKIGSYAFYRCETLTEVVIHDKVTKIESRAFLECIAIQSITIDENNEYYVSIDGNLYDKDVTILWQYALGKEDKEFTVPDSVVFIREFAFLACTHLESLTIPDSVTYIAPYVFNDSPSLKNIYYEGTTEQWEAMEYDKGWLANNVVLHYDGKKQFVISVYIDISGSSTKASAKVLIDNEKIFIDGTLYDSVSCVGSFEYKFADNIYSYLENRGQTEEIEVLEKIESNEKWFILDGVTDSGKLERKAICQIDGVYYVLLVPLNSQDGSAQKIYKIYSTIINLEDFI